MPIVTSDGACPVAMDDEGTTCGRPLNDAPEGADKRPVCLMHSKDPRKQAGPLFNDFWREFEAILTSAADGVANFQSFEFPEVDLRGRSIKAVCRFDKAIFTERASFSQATFTEVVDFSGTTFTQDATFHDATFMRNSSEHSLPRTRTLRV